jgi:hypothetical protein
MKEFEGVSTVSARQVNRGKRRSGQSGAPGAAGRSSSLSRPPARCFVSAMLARSSLRATRAAPALTAAPNARGMATLRELETRLKSVRNIEKITKVRCVHEREDGN